MLQQDFTSKRTFSEIDRCALYLSYVTFGTYVPVSGDKQFQFPGREILVILLKLVGWYGNIFIRRADKVNVINTALRL